MPAAPGCGACDVPECYWDLNYDYEVIQPDHREQIALYEAYAEMEQMYDHDE